MPSPHQREKPVAAPVNVAIPANLHRQIKILAATHGLTLQQVVERSISRGMQEIPNELGTKSSRGPATAPVENGA